MKKTLATLIFAGLLSAAMIIPAAAGDYDIKKGTPVLDGEKDAMYSASYTYEYPVDAGIWTWGGDVAVLDASFNLLWDENYLYIFATSVDATPSSNPGVWNNDAVEFWLIDEALNYKVHAAADGTLFLGTDADGATPWDFAGAKSVGKFTDDGWQVEAALPLNDLSAGRQFDFWAQINDILDDTGTAGTAFFGVNATYTCVADTAAAATGDAAATLGENEIAKGTPALDGKKDDIYNLSYYYEYPVDAGIWTWGGDVAVLEASFNLLWDENYLYIFATSVDATPSSNPGVWNNDAVEYWLIDEGLNYKVHAAADGTLFLGTDADGATPWDFAGAKSVGVFTEDGWAVEAALPLNDLTAGRQFDFWAQINDILDDTGTAGTAFFGVNQTYTLSSFVAAVETEEETTTDTTEDTTTDETIDETITDTTDDTTTEDTTTEAPQTFDAGIVAAIVALVSAAGYAISKKR